VITACATLLPQGTYAVFSYAQQLYVKATGFLVQPIQTFFFSKYSSNVNNKVEEESLVPNAIRLYLAIYILVISIVYWAGKDVLMLIWYKNTNPGVLALGTTYLIANFATLIFSSVGGVYRKIAISHGEVKTLYAAWMMCQLISAGSIYMLTRLWGESGLTFAILFNLGLLNLTSALIVYLKKHLSVGGFKPILIKYSLLFVFTFSIAGFLHSYLVSFSCLFSSLKHIELSVKTSCFAFVIVLLHLFFLHLLGEFTLLKFRRN
jgi:putative peptidoglycan lipid II flippase